MKSMISLVVAASRFSSSHLLLRLTQCRFYSLKMPARPLVLCGPSGVGKSTIVAKITKEFPNAFGFSVSHTTRQPREGEVDGVSYHYVDTESMQKSIDNDEFIETAVFSGNMYGTSKAAVKSVMDEGKICILDIVIILPIDKDTWYLNRCWIDNKPKISKCKTKKIVKLCLHSSKTVQIYLQFDESFYKKSK